MPHPPLILGYHGISHVDPHDDPDRLFVPPERLRAQTERLLSRGYEFVAMAEFARRLGTGEPPERTCALTFDDGTLDLLTEMLPVLRDLGVPGTVYACPGLLGEPYPWGGSSVGARFMTAEELRELEADPLVEIGSHTVEHTDLDDASFDRALEIMTESRRALEQLVDGPVVSFAYPRCLYSPECPAAAERAGYTSAVTCGGRGDWSPYTLRRELIHTPDGPVTFALKSRGIFHHVRDLPPARLARWVTRSYRHRAER